MLAIRRYDPSEDMEKLFELMRVEGEEWSSYWDEQGREPFAHALDYSITLVAYEEDVLCGFCRTMEDAGLDLYIMDLLVHPSHRGWQIGRKLMETLKSIYPGKEIYVLSDVDAYYEKQGYARIGSVFTVRGENSDGL